MKAPLNAGLSCCYIVRGALLAYDTCLEADSNQEILFASNTIIFIPIYSISKPFFEIRLRIPAELFC